MAQDGTKIEGRFDSWGRTDVGRVREHNEDSHYADPKGRFFVRPGRVRVAVGRPVPVKGMKQKDKHDLAGRVRAEIVELLEKMPEK